MSLFHSRKQALIVIPILTILFVGAGIGGSLLGKVFRSTGEQNVRGGGAEVFRVDDRACRPRFRDGLGAERLPLDLTYQEHERCRRAREKVLLDLYLFPNLA